MSGVGSDSFDTALAICRTSRVPTQLWWGQERTLFYNDASLSLVGAADRSSWPEMWDRIGSLVDEVFATATPRTVDNVALPADRYASVSLGPIPGADDRVGGVFCTCVETTDPIRHARRLGTLRALALAPADCHEVSETHAAIARVLATNPHDVPAAVLYLAEGDRLRAVEWVGIAPGAAGLPLEAPLDRWPLDRRAIDVQLVGVAPIRDALVVPVRTRNGVAGVFVHASSPHRPLGVCEQTLSELIADHIGTALGPYERARTSGHGARTALTSLKTIVDVMRLRGPQDTDLDLLEHGVAQAMRLIDELR